MASNKQPMDQESLTIQGANDKVSCVVEMPKSNMLCKYDLPATTASLFMAE